MKKKSARKAASVYLVVRATWRHTADAVYAVLYLSAGEVKRLAKQSELVKSWNGTRPFGAEMSVGYFDPSVDWYDRWPFGGVEEPRDVIDDRSWCRVADAHEITESSKLGMSRRYVDRRFCYWEFIHPQTDEIAETPPLYLDLAPWKKLLKCLLAQCTPADNPVKVDAA